ncbi:hypothetical protein N329_01654, partial [Haliaeetus albicilla]
EGSPQVVELQAVIEVFKKWQDVEVNIIADSLYVVGVVKCLRWAYLKEIDNITLFEKFKMLLFLLNQQTKCYYIMHVRSHTSLPGWITEGNKRADLLANPVWTGPPPSKLLQVRGAHSFFHQPAKVLAKQFQISIADAKAIIQSCAECQKLSGHGDGAVNPRGLQSLQLWQTDVTHVPAFGKLCYVHVSVDTYSLMVWATALAGETSRHLQTHLRQAFAVMGVPAQIETDNGPCFIAQRTQEFFQQWGVTHITGI